jgi:DNA-binding winged helix-turn-helix (wHTH) protein
MEQTNRPDPTIHFGIFEIDPRSGELRKAGTRIRLQDQPFKVLLALLEHPGEVVTREELKRRIWPHDSFGDFDHAVNIAIAKLRTALGDSADLPRYVETVHRRGYRFLIPVASTGTDARTAAEPASAARTWKLVIFAAVPAVVAILVGAFLWHSWQKQRLTDKDTLVLADFTNSTGDPVFDDVLKQALRIQLEQSPFLSLLSEQEVDQGLALMRHLPSQPLSPDVARDLCQRVGSKAVLSGSITSLGSRYVLGLNAFNCYTGKGIASEQVEADSRENVLGGLGVAATKIRKKLGESLVRSKNTTRP